jgi:hypothetical protein
MRFACKQNFRVASLLLAMSLCLATAPVRAQDSKLDKYELQAQNYFEQGDFKKAQNNWTKLLVELTKDSDSLSGDELKARKLRVEKTLRALGQCAINQKDFDSATDLLARARTATVELGQADSELDKAFLDLQANYREIDPNSLPQEATSALKEVGAQKISVNKTDRGQHIQIVLAEKVVTPINSGGVSDVGFDKTISFDMSEGNDGAIKIENISGLKAKVKVWVDIIASSLRRDDSNQPVAEVTGSKLGISQSVSTKLPDEIYQPVMGLIARVKNIFSETVMDNVANSATTSPAGSQAGSSSPTAIIPVVNGSSTPAITGDQATLSSPARNTTGGINIDTTGGINSDTTQPTNPTMEAVPVN